MTIAQLQLYVESDVVLVHHTRQDGRMRERKVEKREEKRDRGKLVGDVERKGG